MKSLKYITVIVVDKGLFVDVAVRIARDVRRVLYHVPNHDVFPLPNASFVGYGLENIEVIQDLDEHAEFADLWVFPDIGFGAMQQRLRDEGRKVWGNGLGECLETDRPLCKELLQDNDLPVAEHKVCQGFTAMVNHLKKSKNVFVKISKWRGVTETFFVKDLKTVQPKLDDIAMTLGPLKELVEFDVECELPDMTEVGYDGYSVLGELPSRSLVGIEVKDAGYAGKVVRLDELSEPLVRVTKAMAELLGQYDARGAFSNEIRMGKEHIPYMIDATVRNPNPPTALYIELYKNFTEIIWHGANGELIDPEILADEQGKEHLYGVQLQLKSDWADSEKFQPLEFDSKLRTNIKIANGCRIDGMFYHIPLRFGLKEVGSIVGWGHSYEEAIKMIEGVAKQIEGFSLKKNVDELQKAMKQVEEAKELSGFDLT